MSRFGVSPAPALHLLATAHRSELRLTRLALFTVTHLHKLSIASAIQPQFNPSILPAYALFSHRDSYEPGCTLGLFSSAAAIVTLIESHVAILRSLQRTCYRVYHNASATLRPLRRIILSGSLPGSIYTRLSLCNGY
jgi:hypothetical protein